MSNVDLIANKDFSYMTRRLKAGEQFECKARDAKVLTGIGLARTPREIGSLPRPPASLMTKVVAPTAPSPAPAKRRRKAPAKKG